MEKEKEDKQNENEADLLDQNFKLDPEPNTTPISQSNKLEGKVALITGGDSGIGKATALLFAANGADIAIAYLDDDKDAKSTQQEIEKLGRECLLIEGDLSKEENCKLAVDKTLEKFSKLDIVVNNVAVQWETDGLEDISAEQLERTFSTNVFSYFWVTKYALPHLKEGSSILNTSSVNAYSGHGRFIDYSATKSAIIGFTRSLAQSVGYKNIRVNAVAPGPIWTELLAKNSPDKKIEDLGHELSLGRAGQPNEVATCFLFLASDDSSYMTGQCLHPNGGDIVNG